MKRLLQRAAAAWDVAERAALGILVLGMVAVSATQIVLRNFFGTGLRWADPLLGTSVLWITMLGALAATGALKHIKIDLVSHFLPRRLKLAAVALTNLFGAAVCGLLVYAAVRYVVFQKEMGDDILPNLPVWTTYTILPVGFALIAGRFLLDAVLAAVRAFSANPPDPDMAAPVDPGAGPAPRKASTHVRLAEVSPSRETTENIPLEGEAATSRRGVDSREPGEKP